MTPQDVLTVEGVAELLQITINTIQRKSWREKTGCPLRKKGRRLYAIRSEITNWIKG